MNADKFMKFRNRVGRSMEPTVLDVVVPPGVGAGEPVSFAGPSGEPLEAMRAVMADDLLAMGGHALRATLRRLRLDRHVLRCARPSSAGSGRGAFRV